MLVIVIIIFAIIGAIEIPPLFRKRDKMKKELMIYIVLLGAGFILCVLLALGVDIPSPADAIENTLKSMGIVSPQS